MSLIFNSNSPKKIIYNNNDVKTLIYNGVQVWRKKLPDEYQEVEFLQNSGTQFINTEVVPKPNYKFYIKYTDVGTGGSNYVTGARPTSSGTIYTAITGPVADQSIQVAYQSGATTPNKYRKANYTYIVEAEYTEDMTGWGRLECLDTEDVFNGTQTALVPNNLTATVKIFGLRVGNVHKGIKVYEYKQWIDNVLERYFVPCYRKSDDEAGMYDLIYDEFYTNAGSGTFIVGNDV